MTTPELTVTHKPRRFDLSPDNFIAGVAGQLSAEELGVYWLICLLIYSHCGEIEYDEQRLVKLLPGTHWRNIRAASQRLQQLGKIEVSDGHVMAKGCEAPLQEAITRVSNAVQHGRTGGRPIRESKDLSEADGLNSEKLARDAPSPSPSPPESSHTTERKRKSYHETFNQNPVVPRLRVRDHRTFAVCPVDLHLRRVRQFKRTLIRASHFAGNFCSPILREH